MKRQKYEISNQIDAQMSDGLVLRDYYINQDRSVIEIENCADVFQLSDLHNEIPHIAHDTVPCSAMEIIPTEMPKKDYQELLERIWPYYYENNKERFVLLLQDEAEEQYVLQLDGVRIYDDADFALPSPIMEEAKCILMENYFYAEVDFARKLKYAELYGCPLYDLFCYREFMTDTDRTCLWVCRSDKEKFECSLPQMLYESIRKYLAFLEKHIYRATVFFTDGTVDIGRDAVLFGNNLMENGMNEIYGKTERIGVFSNVFESVRYYKANLQ